MSGIFRDVYLIYGSGTRIFMIIRCLRELDEHIEHAELRCGRR